MPPVAVDAWMTWSALFEANQKVLGSATTNDRVTAT
jgi:hypothetical protein